MLAVDDHSARSLSLIRWRTAFWTAIVATPLVAGVLGALIGQLQHGQPHRAVKVASVIGAVVLANMLAWRWPRASGVALGVAAPFLAVGLFWAVSLGVTGVAE